MLWPINSVRESIGSHRAAGRPSETPSIWPTHTSFRAALAPAAAVEGEIEHRACRCPVELPGPEQLPRQQHGYRNTSVQSFCRDEHPAWPTWPLGVSPC